MLDRVQVIYSAVLFISGSTSIFCNLNIANIPVFLDLVIGLFLDIVSCLLIWSSSGVELDLGTSLIALVMVVVSRIASETRFLMPNSGNSRTMFSSILGQVEGLISLAGRDILVRKLASRCSSFHQPSQTFPLSTRHHTAKQRTPC